VNHFLTKQNFRNQNTISWEASHQIHCLTWVTFSATECWSKIPNHTAELWQHFPIIKSWFLSRRLGVQEEFQSWRRGHMASPYMASKVIA